ncbi:MAG: hypothetical protein AB7J35_05055 [Dehalococcoidia bacterium]
MTIRATIGVYPMRQEGDVAITRASEALKGSGVEVEVRAMQSELRGEPDAIWAALRRAFDAADGCGPVVVTMAVSNACG